jgi:hypothetical protein
MYRSIILIAVAAVLAASCAKGPELVPPGIILGTVEFVDVEGGCWKIRADDGTSYEPLNMPEEFVRDGLRVAVVLSVVDNLGSFCQVGILVNVESITTANTR